MPAGAEQLRQTAMTVVALVPVIDGAEQIDQDALADLPAVRHTGADLGDVSGEIHAHDPGKLGVIPGMPRRVKMS